MGKLLKVFKKQVLSLNVKLTLTFFIFALFGALLFFLIRYTTGGF